MAGKQSRINGQKGGKKETPHLLELIENLDTGEPAKRQPVYYASMGAAAHVLKLDIAILKNAKARGCDAFAAGAAVHRERFLTWLKANPVSGEQTSQDEINFIEEYTVTDETGGVGQTLKSLQTYERRCKQALDNAEKSTTLFAPIKAELVKIRQDAWLKVVGQLLKYDLSVAQSKRESGELIPIEDAKRGVQALLAWHTIATSDAIRNCILLCEGKNKFEIAAILDEQLRAAIYRNFKLGQKLGKLPEWMCVTASDHVKQEKPINVNPTNLDDF